MARGIYKIINIVNNKFYVGSAEDFARRKRVHWWMLRKGNHANKHLQAAWNKYGEAAFTFVIVEEHVANINILAAENLWLHEHVGKDYCYNLGTDATAPNTGMYGEKNAMYGKTFTHTEEAKAKIAKASAERVQTEEEKTKRRQTMRGHIVPKETRTKISATLSGKGNFWYGKQRPDHGAKVSKAIEVYKDDVLLKVYDSIKALRDETGMKPPTINRALKSGTKITRGNYIGYFFKYACTVTK
jgi:group I intron endonuclease